MAAEVPLTQLLLPNLGHQVAVHDALDHLLPAPQLPDVAEQLPGQQQGDDVVVEHFLVVQVDHQFVHHVVVVNNGSDVLDQD